MKRKESDAALVAVALLLASSQAIAARKTSGEFSVASLDGRYGVQESEDGSTAAGLGVVEYDGAGKAMRKMTVNAPDGSGGRRILLFESDGAYTVNPDDTGAVTFTNIAPNPGAADAFDFLITGTGAKSILGQGQTPLATEVFAAQREAGVTVSLVTSVQ